MTIFYEEREDRMGRDESTCPDCGGEERHCGCNSRCPDCGQERCDCDIPEEDFGDEWIESWRNFLADDVCLPENCDHCPHLSFCMDGRE